ncbi:rCG36948 [Rattus norvegicus]|uniref:RCG36948 n=1 Tax=Rattus norvegicus TaxID=10116 RepID=A6HUK6_RAT|nr:rCG36948 [Rattus norvegicus]
MSCSQKFCGSAHSDWYHHENLIVTNVCLMGNQNIEWKYTNNVVVKT